LVHTKLQFVKLGAEKANILVAMNPNLYIIEARLPHKTKLLSFVSKFLQFVKLDTQAPTICEARYRKLESLFRYTIPKIYEIRCRISTISLAKYPNYCNF
jgi:hypothetical protein